MVKLLQSIRMTASKMANASDKSEVAASYDQWAETYDTVQNSTRDLAAEVLRQANLTIAGRKLVEVGCGTGRNTEWLAHLAAAPAEILALDFSEGMLARAGQRVQDSRVLFLKHDVRATWPLPDASVDLAIVMLVLEHVEHLQPFFGEAARTLTAGGDLFICELHPMRQLLGGQAQFTDAKTGARQLVDAFLHDTSDYISAALMSGFELVTLGEPRDANALQRDPPRLLSLLFRKPLAK